MLIIAIPKSASTALMSTLSAIHGVPGRQIFFRDAPSPEGFNVLRRYHSDTREINADLAKQFADGAEVFKQHLPPTPNNVALLHNCSKVIVLREPHAIIAAYRRARRRFLSVSMPGFDILADEQAWQRTARENGLCADLEQFIAGWSDASVANKLVIWYHELMADPTATINAIEQFWGLRPTPGPIQIARQRYSGRGAWRTGLFNLVRMLLQQVHLWTPIRAAVRKLRGRQPETQNIK